MNSQVPTWIRPSPVERQEQHAGLAVMMRLFDDLIEQLTCVNRFIGIDGNTGGFGLFAPASRPGEVAPGAGMVCPRAP